MKKFNRIIATALSSAMLVSSFAAPAWADTLSGSVTINGQVTDATCAVNPGLGATGTKDMTVQLDPTPTASVATAGTPAGGKAFQILIGGTDAGCALSATNLPVLTFDTGGTVQVDAANAGTLKNLLEVNLDPSAANNVNIQLLALATSATAIASGTAIDLSDPGLTFDGVASATQPQTGSQYEFNFAARYYATGTGTAGYVKAFIPFSISYN